MISKVSTSLRQYHVTGKAINAAINVNKKVFLKQVAPILPQPLAPITFPYAHFFDSLAECDASGHPRQAIKIAMKE